MPAPDAIAAPFARTRVRVGLALLLFALALALGLSRATLKTAAPASVVPPSNLSSDTRSIAHEAAPLASAPISAEVEPPGFMGRPERALLERLREEPLTAARKGSGGRTLAFKVTLASGLKAYLKPEQSVSSAHWYAEVAAYHLDRALGLGRVPPVTSRSFAWAPLEKAAADDRRIPEVKVGRDGRVRAALVAWLNEPLVPATTPRGWENWVRSEAFPRTTASPYRRPAAYGSALARIHERAVQQLPRELFYETVPAIPERDLPAALSDMIVFDFLTLNYDRFGGDNANVLTLGPNGPLIFLDNGDGFSDGPVRRQLLDERLAPLSRFRRRTIDALRALDMRAFAAGLAREPLAPILDARALAGLAARRAIVLEHVAAQQRRYGDVIYAW
ncbi:MAG TPA: hypothetical protein VGI70_11975 [Polyangiales bacterium]|jgi:hypothetical protein